MILKDELEAIYKKFLYATTSEEIELAKEELKEYKSLKILSGEGLKLQKVMKHQCKNIAKRMKDLNGKAPTDDIYDRLV